MSVPYRTVRCRRGFCLLLVHVLIVPYRTWMIRRTRLRAAPAASHTPIRTSRRPYSPAHQPEGRARSWPGRQGDRPAFRTQAGRAWADPARPDRRLRAARPDAGSLSAAADGTRAHRGGSPGRSGTHRTAAYCLPAAWPDRQQVMAGQ